MQKVFIVILNYKKWQDVVECLESVFRLDYENFSVVVIDNDSGNDSLKHIMDWAGGRLESKQSPYIAGVFRQTITGTKDSMRNRVTDISDGLPTKS